mmetsp:Transcript_15182/g.38561  ORF Transcript_15182/g.38561 Transcript_15182/m.38561 type:complete len:313 (+) Transcript_15182:1458-2396(+)
MRFIVNIAFSASQLRSVVAQTLELIETMRTEFSSNKEKTSSQHSHRVGHRNRVKILHTDRRDDTIVILQCDLEQVAQLSLKQEEEHTTLCVCGVTDDEHATLIFAIGAVAIEALTTRQTHHHIWVVLVLVDQQVLGAHQHATGSVWRARHSDETVGSARHLAGPLAHHVVETEVQLVEGHVGRDGHRGTRLLLVGGQLCAVGTIRRVVVHLEHGEERVLEADIHAGHVDDDHVAAVCLQRTADRQTCCTVSVQDVDQFLLLQCGHHHGTSLRIGGHILSGYDTTAATTTKGLFMNLVKTSLSTAVLFLALFT